MKQFFSRLSLDTRYLLGLLGIFFGSRAVLLFLGLDFNLQYLESAWQILDTTLLRDNLLESLWYLHMQPPLFNGMIGVVLKAFPSTFGSVFHVLYLACGALLTYLFFRLLRTLQISHAWSAGATLLFMMSPSVILFEHFFFYDYLLLVMLMGSALLLQVYGMRKKMLHLVLFFLLLSTIVLTRSMFHILWFVVLVTAVIWCFRTEWKKICIAALIPFLLIVGWYGKNAFLLGTFGASSWMGMGMYKAALFLSDDSEIERLVQNGIIAPNISPDAFSTDITKLDLLERESSSIPFVDNHHKSNGHVNYNHGKYLEFSEDRMNDVKSILRHEPRIYIKSVIAGGIIFFAPASNYLSSNLQEVSPNYEAIQWIAKPYEWLVYGQPLSFVSNDMLGGFADRLGIAPTQLWRLLSPGILIFAMYMLSLVYGGMIICRKKLREKMSNAEYAVVLFLLLNILYVTAVGMLFEVGENQRFRFMIEPFCWILVLLYIKNRLSNRRYEEN